MCIRDRRVVVGAITPIGGPSSMLIFVHRLRQRGVRPADALLTVSIKSVIGNFAFLLLLAYVVGMVFLLVAPVFQGIGFVEVSMALALEHLGVPAAAAVSATLLCRVGELWLPLLAGIVVQLTGMAPGRPDPPLPVAKGGVTS